jgi:WD40 repeat protein
MLLAGIVLLVRNPGLHSDEPATQPQTLPTGAVTSLGTSRFLNLGRVYSVAFTPDGKTLATGCWDGSVRLWEVATGKELNLFQDTRSPVRAMAFSADGKLLAYDCEGMGIVVRQTATGTEVHRLKGHRGPITFVCFSPDGKLLASKGHDQTFRLWDMAGGREARRLSSLEATKQIPDPNCPIAFGLDGKTVLSATFPDRNFGREVQRAFRVWDVASGAEMRFLKDDASRPAAFAFSPEARLLAVADGSLTVPPQRIRLWDMDSGQALRPIELPQTGDTATLAFLAFSPDGKMLAASGGGPIHLWEMATRQEVCRFPVNSTGPVCLAFSPTGRLLASGSVDISALLWDVTGHMRNGKLQPAKLSPEECRLLWEDLAGQDAAKGWRALWTFVAADADSVAFLRSCLHPTVKTDSDETITRLVADLDHSRFPIRSKAKAQLAQLGELAEAALREAENDQPSLEQRQRIQELLKAIADQRSSPTGDRLRGFRAVQVLEQIDTPAARQLLQTLTRGAAGALLTREAQESLARLAHRTATAPAGR